MLPPQQRLDLLRNLQVRTVSFLENSESKTKVLVGTAVGHIEALPLQPEITPALGIAGVILIGTGLVYALIGIKSKW
jgi:hypothetical protein